MNKRARNRLIGVTVIVLALVGGFAVYLLNTSGSVSTSVADVLKDPTLVGKRVKVSGTVVEGSWDKGTSPMRFTIRDEGATGGSVLKVVYTGSAPNTFGDGVVAIVTGTLAKGGTIESSDMITKCPSKYESATGAMPVASLKAGEALAKATVTGFVKPGSVGTPGSEPLFLIAEKADGTGKSVAVTYSKGLPEGVKDGVSVVVKGDVKADGTLVASSVALAGAQK